MPILSGPGRLLELTGEVHLPPVLNQLYIDRRKSPWSFVLSLAFLLGGNVHPRGTLFKLKLGLHLSPVCDHDPHVLAAGAGSVFTPPLIRECLGLAVRSVVYTSTSSGGKHLQETGGLLGSWATPPCQGGGPLPC